MPLVLSFVTCWRNGILCLIFVSASASCGALRWHSIEQTPAEPIAYMRDGVYVSGAYVRSALIAEIDGNKVIKPSNNLVEVPIGKHIVKVFCDEAEGEFNSNEFSGVAKTLEFEAHIQRTYLVRCTPFTHWWIEDLESNSVVAGEKFN